MIRRLLAFVLVLALAPLPLPASTGTVMPYAKIQLFDNNGLVCNGCKLYAFAAGTSTPQNTYSDAALTSANAHPVVLDSAGRATVFLSSTSYKFRLDSAADVTLWTVDSVGAVPFVNVDLDITGTAGEALSAGNSVYLSDGTGGCGATVGRWYKTDADLTCASTTAQALGFIPTDIASGAAGTVRIQGRVTGLAGLAAGSVYYISATAGAITSSAPTNLRAVGVADSATSLVVSSGLTPAPATATQSGIVTATAQEFGGTKTVTLTPTFATLPAGIGAYKFSCSTSNLTKNNSSVLADVTGVSFAVSASEDYIFVVYAYGISSNTANFKFTFTGPASPTAIRFGAVGISGVGGVASAAAFGTAVLTAGIGAAPSVDQLIILSGRLRNGANAGTVQLQFAQSTNEVADSIIYANTCVMAWRSN